MRTSSIANGRRHTRDPLQCACWGPGTTGRSRATGHWEAPWAAHSAGQRSRAHTAARATGGAHGRDGPACRRRQRQHGAPACHGSSSSRLLSLRVCEVGRLLRLEELLHLRDASACSPRRSAAPTSPHCASLRCLVAAVCGTVAALDCAGGRAVRVHRMQGRTHGARTHLPPLQRPPPLQAAAAPARPGAAGGAGAAHELAAAAAAAAAAPATALAPAGAPSGRSRCHRLTSSCFRPRRLIRPGRTCA